MTATGTDRRGAPGPDAHWRGRDASGRPVLLTEILAQVSGEALQGETLVDVLQRIVDCLTRQLPVAIASIILLDDDGTHFVDEVWSGDIELDDAAGGRPWPVTEGAAGRCARTRDAQLIADVHRDPDYVPGNRDVRSEYIVPIEHRTRLHGVLNLESTCADFFTPEVCAMFDAVALQVAGTIHLARVVHELELANRKLQELSMSDGLTGIANRRCFDLRLEEEWRRHAMDHLPLALLMIDVDCFKHLNDAQGHLCGDECLRVLARLCASIARPGELIARYGGEEFALLLPHRGMRDARRVAERVRRAVEALALSHPQSTVAPHVTISIGVSAACPDGALAPEALVVAADGALYTAKRKGRNRVASRAVARRRTASVPRRPRESSLPA